MDTEELQRSRATLVFAAQRFANLEGAETWRDLWGEIGAPKNGGGGEGVGGGGRGGGRGEGQFIKCLFDG